MAIQRRVFAVDEYEAMWRAGVFAGDDRLELLDVSVQNAVRLPPDSEPEPDVDDLLP